MSEVQADERSDAEGGAWDSAFLRARLQRVMELPLPPEGGGVASGDAFGLQRRGGLAALFHGGGVDGRGLVWGWLRGARSGPVELLSSEPVLAPAGSGLVPAPGAVDLLEGIGSWAEVAIRPVGFSSSRDDADRHGPLADEPGSTSSVESVLLRVWDRPFTLLVMAVPVERAEAEAVAERAADGMRYAGQRRDRSPDLSSVYDRLAWWHREVLSGASSGLWWVRLLTGGQSGREALELAGLAAASFGVGELGYELVPLTAGREERLSFLHASVMSGAGGGDHADNRSARGFLAGTGLLAALTRPPSTEVPGVRQVLPSTFDTTSEHPAGRGVGLGVLLDGQRRPAGRMVVPYASLNRHGLIPGATGSGKSMTARAITEGLIGDGVPVCAIEPAKAEWATALASRLPETEVVRIAPGDPGQVAACIDPMRPIEGFALQTHIDLVRSLFLAAFDADEPFPQVLSAALQRAYERQGWNALLSTPSGGPGGVARYPTLADLQAAAAEVVREVGYGPEVHQNIQGFIKVRLSALRLGTSGRFLEGGHPIDMARLLSSNVVLEIQDVGDDAEKAFIIGAFLLKLTEHYRVLERRGGIEPGVLRHVTVIEEAHRLLRNPEGHAAAGNRAVEMFAALLAEVRAYGEGVLVCEQIPSKLIPDTIKNTSVKICHRLPAKDDRDLVGATMNLTAAQSEYLVTVRPGEAAVFADGMDRPVLVRVPDTTTRERDTTKKPVGPAGLVEPVFGLCAAAYGLTGVSLGTVARARELLDRTPMAVCWAELAVLAHLTGRTAPRPSLAVSRALADEVWRTAIVLAVDDAVAARSQHLRDRIPPAGLAAHIAGALIGMVEGGPACGHEPEWIATPWLWDRPAHELAQHRAAHPGGLECGRPHPDTDTWQATYGRVPGGTCADQHTSIEARRREAQTSQSIEDLIFGTTTPAALEHATGLSRADDGWADRIDQLATGFDAPWASPILAPRPE